jgi:hypothetical protein
MGDAKPPMEVQETPESRKSVRNAPKTVKKESRRDFTTAALSPLNPDSVRADT